MTAGHVIGPVHEYERQCCGLDCLEARAAFKASSHALRVHWYHRKLGQKPMPAWLYRRKYENVPVVSAWA